MINIAGATLFLVNLVCDGQMLIFLYYFCENNDYQFKFLLITAAAEIFCSALP